MLRLPEKNPKHPWKILEHHQTNPLAGWSSWTLEGPCLPMPFVVGRLCLADSCRCCASQPQFRSVGFRKPVLCWLPTKTGGGCQKTGGSTTVQPQTECFVTSWGKRKWNFFMEGSLWITRVKHVSWKKRDFFFRDRMDADEKRALRQRTQACSWIVIWINIAHLLSLGI